MFSALVPSATSFFALFFFYFYVAPRALHSFPTRRSSDLASLFAFQRDLEARGVADRVLTLVWSEFGRRANSDHTRVSTRSRSEEYTSVLQTQFRRVCQLLLEKKNKNKQRNNVDIIIRLKI